MSTSSYPIKPRERLQHVGVRSLSEQELIALVLGTGIRGSPAISLAIDVLGSIDSLASLAEARVDELARLSGIGPARAAKIIAAVELGRRTLGEAPNRVRVSCAADVHRLLRTRAPATKEVFWALGLDARHRLIEVVRIAEGSLVGVDVHPREVFRPLVRMGAVAAVVAHNHPSGDPTPSAEDLAVTHRLCDAGQLIGIPVLDHVIVTSAHYESLAESNVL